MNRAQIRFYGAWLLCAGAGTSLFLFAAFDYTWWTPMAEDRVLTNIARFFILAALHVAGFAAGIWAWNLPEHLLHRLKGGK